MKNNITKSDLLPFHTIKAATNGDIEAINRVLKHYEGYIYDYRQGNYMMNLDRYIIV